jgi:RHS repeat-associated protein
MANQESNTFYSHADHLGSNRLVTDENKNIVAAISYHPFGEPHIEEGSEHYLFTGKEKDATGLYYYGARYYDPDLGRFLTRDPLKGDRPNPQRLNRYTYCLNNPIKLIDPWGEKDFSIDGGGEQEEPEVIGNPSYDGHGQITVPTSMGDVTIDLDTDEDWGDVDDKVKQNQAREEYEELEQGREKYKENQAKENRNIRRKYNVMVMGGTPEIEGEGEGDPGRECSEGAGHMWLGGILASLGAGLYFASPYLAPAIVAIGNVLSLSIVVSIGMALPLIGIGLLAVGVIVLAYGAYKNSKGCG